MNFSSCLYGNVSIVRQKVLWLWCNRSLFLQK